MVYKDTGSTFQKFLQLRESFGVPQKNVQILTAQVYQIVNDICPPIMNRSCFKENKYNHRNIQEIKQQKIRTVWCGLEAAAFQAPQLWYLVPLDIKSLLNVNLFKSKIKQWKYTECPCRLWGSYLKK